MESNYNRDFERYVQQNADQYRMFPSEKVWKGVHNALHTRRKWYGFGLAFLLLVTGGAVTLVMRSYPVSKKQDTASVKLNPNLPFTSAPEKETAATPASNGDGIKDLLPLIDQLPASIIQNGNARALELTETSDPATGEDLIVSTGSVANLNFSRPLDNFTSEPQQVSPATVTEHLQNFAIAPSAAVNTTLNPAENNTREKTQLSSNKTENRVAALPYTIESVVNQYKAPPAKLSWQLFLTPTVSYRKLSENSSFASVPGSFTYPFASLEDVNKAVTHKPDLGLQIGLMARYPLSKKLSVRAGLQFNINRYDIKAFAYPVEEAIINLDGGPANSVSTWTQYRSQSGYKSDWLKNFYFSVSLPVGAELTLFGNKKTSVGIAGTIQPTYIISDRAYLISTDYKNYAKVPWLIRHVNMSTGFETFVNYTRGKTKWQVGPQVRYQLLSSFQNKYPVKENLFDFGVKVGVTLNNK